MPKETCRNLLPHSWSRSWDDRQQKHILITGSDPLLLRAVDLALAEQGYATRLCSDHSEALQIARDEQQDMLVIGLEQAATPPGSALLTQLREINPGMRCVMIACPNHAEQTSAAGTEPIGNLIQRPFSMMQLIAVVDESIATDLRPAT